MIETEKALEKLDKKIQEVEKSLLNTKTKLISRDELNKDIDKILELKNSRIVKRKRNKFIERIRKIFRIMFSLITRDSKLFNNEIEELRKKEKIIF